MPDPKMPYETLTTDEMEDEYITVDEVYDESFKGDGYEEIDAESVQDDVYITVDESEDGNLLHETLMAEEANDESFLNGGDMHYQTSDEKDESSVQNNADYLNSPFKHQSNRYENMNDENLAYHKSEKSLINQRKANESTSYAGVKSWGYNDRDENSLANSENEQSLTQNVMKVERYHNSNTEHLAYIIHGKNEDCQNVNSESSACNNTEDRNSSNHQTHGRNYPYHGEFGVNLAHCNRDIQNLSYHEKYAGNVPSQSRDDNVSAYSNRDDENSYPNTAVGNTNVLHKRRKSTVHETDGSITAIQVAAGSQLACHTTSSTNLANNICGGYLAFENGWLCTPGWNFAQFHTKTTFNQGTPFNISTYFDFRSICTPTYNRNLPNTTCGRSLNHKNSYSCDLTCSKMDNETSPAYINFSASNSLDVQHIPKLSDFSFSTEFSNSNVNNLNHDLNSNLNREKGTRPPHSLTGNSSKLSDHLPPVSADELPVVLPPNNNFQSYPKPGSSDEKNNPPQQRKIRLSSIDRKESKCKRLKRMKEKIVHLEKERKYLKKKIVELENMRDAFVNYIQKHMRMKLTLNS